MRNGLGIIWLVVGFICFSSARAQLTQPVHPVQPAWPGTYIFTHIGHKNGLLYDNVQSINQDKKGFIWIGMENALQRYDGIRFIDYSDSIAGSGDGTVNIGTIFNDSAGRGLWLFANNRLQQLQPLTHRIISYTIADLMADKIVAGTSYTDANRVSWKLTRTCITRENSAEKTITGSVFCISPQFPARFVNMIRDRRRRQTWLASNTSGLLLFDDSTKTVYSHEYNPLGSPLLRQLEQKNLDQIIIDRRNNIWVTTWSGTFFRYDPKTQHLSRYTLPVDGKRKKDKGEDLTVRVTSILDDHFGTVWLTTENAGLLKYEGTTDRFEYLQSTGNEGIQYNYEIHCIFQDRENNIWMGTDRGINMFNPYRQYFVSLRHEPGNPRSLSKHEVMTYIETRKGDLLVGTWGGGITIFDRQLAYKGEITFTGPPEKNLIWSSIQQDDGNIWIGCQHGWLHMLNPTTGSIRTIHPAEFQNSTIRCMEKDSAGNVFFGLHNGKIAEWSRRDQKFYPYNDSLSAASSLSSAASSFSPVGNIFIDHSGPCWACTEKGLRQFDPERRVFTSLFPVGRNDPHTASGGWCRGIEQYNDSILLVGTGNSGLNAFNIRSGIFTTVIPKQGLPEGGILALKKDSKGDIWFTTMYGLYKFQPGQSGSIAYNMDEASLHSIFEASRFYTTADGRWLTSTLTEMIGFYPDSLDKQTNPPAAVTISGFRVFDQPVFIDSLLYAQQPVRLPYRKNFLTIEFTPLRFSTGPDLAYAYWLTGVDTGWTNAGTNKFASYTNLAPGSYVFRIKAMDRNNTGPLTSMTIIISPPFWKTTWFYLLYLILAATILYGLFRWRTRSIRKEEAVKALFNKQMAEMEMKALRSQMNPHFLFNSLNSINRYILENDTDNASEYLSMFSKLMRMILDNAQQSFLTLDQEIAMLDMYLRLEHMRFGNKFDYSLTIDKDINTMELQLPSLLLQPYVENALWHGLLHKEGKGLLRINFGHDDDEILITIEDNGIGRKRAAEIRKNRLDRHLSKGLILIEERLKLLAQEKKARIRVAVHDLLDSQGDAGGTRIEIRMATKLTTL
jgi:ligand-binding sensor domain-containing protein